MSIIESANGVGARLAEARSEQGMSVEDLSSRTYIRPAVIRGIENDDFSPCGGPFYARGHIRTLARTLGIEESSVLSQFDRQHGAPEPRLGPETTTAEPAPRRPAKARAPRALAGTNGRGGPGWMAVATVVLIAVCVVALVSLLVGGPSKKDGNTQAAQPSSPQSKRSTAPKAATPPVAPRVYSGVNLTVRLANGSSWVKVTDENGRVLASSVGSQGMSAEFRGAQQLRFTFGNAAAITASCNGKALGSLGSEGQVVTRTLVLGDPACGASTG
jgi:cytoskeletal protein RodZ